MFKATPAVFVGKDRSPAFRDYIAEAGFFFLFEAEEGMTKTHGHALMKDIKRLKDEKGDIRSLGDLEVWMTGLSRIKDMPDQFSAAVGVLVGDVVYLETVGAGEVHLRRGKDFVRLIHGAKSASGYIKEGDMFVFTTRTFRALIEEEEKLQDPMDNDPPKGIVSALEDYFDNKDDQGSTCIFAEFTQKGAPAGAASEDIEDAADAQAVDKMGFTAEDTDEETDVKAKDDIKHTPRYHQHAVEATEVEDDDAVVTPAAPVVPPVAAPPLTASPTRRSGLPVMDMSDMGGSDDTDAGQTQPKSNIFSKFKFALPQSKLSKKTSRMLTIAIVVLLAGILIWSVVLGNQRRMAAEAQKKIQATEMEVDKKIAQADEDAFLNLDRSVGLLAEAKTDVSNLQKEIGKGYSEPISRMNKKITAKENEIMHKDEKQPEEFYDLALEEKDARGDVMYLEDDRIAILDTENKTIYNLSAEKKSIEKSKNAILSSARRVGMVKGVLFAFVPGQGFYRFEDDTKVKKVIDNDKDWGTIADLAFFGGNVYMLDSGKQDVYKYTLIADGYAPKTSYFTGSKPDLEDARALKIDASIYIGLSNNILKYTKGEAESFSVDFPTSKLDIEKIYTDEDTAKVYAWDKTNGAIYVVGKTGSYEKQIKASVLAKASDFIVYKNEILVLSGSKIYKLTE